MSNSSHEDDLTYLALNTDECLLIGRVVAIFLLLVRPLLLSRQRRYRGRGRERLPDTAYMMCIFID